MGFAAGFRAGGDAIKDRQARIDAKDLKEREEGLRQALVGLSNETVFEPQAATSSPAVNPVSDATTTALGLGGVKPNPNSSPAGVPDAITGEGGLKGTQRPLNDGELLRRQADLYNEYGFTDKAQGLERDLRQVNRYEALDARDAKAAEQAQSNWAAGYLLKTAEFDAENEQRVYENKMAEDEAAELKKQTAQATNEANAYIAYQNAVTAKVQNQMEAAKYDQFLTAATDKATSTLSNGIMQGMSIADIANQPMYKDPDKQAVFSSKVQALYMDNLGITPATVGSINKKIRDPITAILSKGEGITDPDKELAFYNKQAQSVDILDPDATDTLSVEFVRDSKGVVRATYDGLPLEGMEGASAREIVEKYAASVDGDLLGTAAQYIDNQRLMATKRIREAKSAEDAQEILIAMLKNGDLSALEGNPQMIKQLQIIAKGGPGWEEVDDGGTVTDRGLGGSASARDGGPLPERPAAGTMSDETRAARAAGDVAQEPMSYIDEVMLRRREREQGIGLGHNAPPRPTLRSYDDDRDPRRAGLSDFVN
jgi:hypothetical protein